MAPPAVSLPKQIEQSEEARGAGGPPGAALAARLARAVGAQHFARFFGDGSGLRVGPGELCVSAGSSFMAGVLERRFGDLLTRLANDASSPEGGGAVSVRYVVDDAATHAAREVERATRAAGNVPSTGPVDASSTVGREGRHAPPSDDPARHEPARHESPRYDPSTHAWQRRALADIVPGACNRLALSAAAALTRDPAGAPPVLCVHGACGTGKTLLLEAIAGELRRRHAAMTVRVTSAEAFVNAFVASCGSRKFDAFRRRFRQVSVLCVDDLDTLAGKPRTQQEFLSTLDALGAAGGGHDQRGAAHGTGAHGTGAHGTGAHGSGRMCGRVVVTLSAPPRQVPGLLPALVSRLSAGMVVELAPPEAALRTSLVAALAARRGLMLDADGAGLIARHAGMAAGPRDLEGLVLRVEAMHRLVLGRGQGVPVALGAVIEALGGGDLASAQARRWTVRDAATSPPASESHDAGGVASGLGAAPRAAAGTSWSGAGSARPPVRFAAIAAAVCRAVGTTLDDLKSRQRAPAIVLGRALCTHIARDLTTLSYPEIARELGRSNHSTFITAHQRLMRQMAAGGAWPACAGGVGMGTGGSTLQELVDHVRFTLGTPLDAARLRAQLPENTRLGPGVERAGFGGRA